MTLPVFQSPEWFLLIPALALVGWFWRPLRLHSPLRATLIVLASILLADPRLKRQHDSLDLWVLLDRSESTEALVDQGLPEWQRLLEQHKPSRRDTLHYLNYAAEVADLGADGVSFTGSRKLTRTNLALQHVVSQVPSDRPSRVLLFTDGYATEPLHEAAAQLQARGVPMDFRLVREETDKDFRVARIEFPERVQAGEPFLMKVVVRGSQDLTLPLVIRRSGQLLAESEVKLENGVGVAEFTDRIPRAGAFHYEAEIRPTDDSHPGNNRADRWIEITGGPRVLLVSRYANDPAAAVLRSQNFSVDVVSEPGSLTPGRLSGARAVIINNVPAHEIPSDFLAAIDFFVREQGGGFLMAGGERSFGSGGYFQSSIDALLPISMEMKEEHRKLSVALAIVMDRSGSMAVQVPGAGGKSPTKMDLADSGAADAIDLLGNMDEVAVFAVDSEPETVIPLTVVGNRKRDLGDRVRRVKSQGGGIFVYEGLKAAWDTLQKSKSGTRHVILFSDANDSEEPGDYKKLLKTMTDNGCTVSVIGMGTKADSDSALLEDIAKLGNGRIFFADRPVDIPKIFAQETVTIARSAFVKDNPVGTRATGRWAEITPKAIEWPALVDGYNLSYAREDATVSLVSTDEYLAPLVAQARRGLGRTGAVSFPLGGDYSEKVRAWPAYGDFLQTTTRWLMGMETPPGIGLRHRLEGTRLTLDLLYDTDLWGEKLAAKPPRIKLLEDGAGKQSYELPWKRLSPGHFSITTDLEAGSVVRGAIQVGDAALPFGPVSVGSSVEWAFEPERLTELRAVSNQTGGRELIDLSKAWLRPPSIQEASLRLPLGIALLVIALVEALMTRTGWKLPAFALAPSRKPAKGPVPVIPKKTRVVQAEPTATPTVAPSTPDLPPAPPSEPDETERRSRYQRAKDRR